MSNILYASVIMELQNQQPVATYTYGDDLISYHQGTGSQYYLYDALGSTRILTNENGQMTDSYNYDAFGTNTEHQGTSNNKYQYAGEQKDVTGNYYLRARYYNPSVGRFTQMDSYMGQSNNPITLHKYLYANANPVMYTDPSGYFGLGGFSFGGLVSMMQSAARYSTIAINTLDKVDTVLTLVQMTRGADQAFDAVRRELKSQKSASTNLKPFIEALNNSDEAAMTLAANTGWLIGQMALPKQEDLIKQFLANPKNDLIVYAPTPRPLDTPTWLSVGTRIPVGTFSLAKAGKRNLVIELGRGASQGGRMVGVGHTQGTKKHSQGTQWWRMDWHPVPPNHNDDRKDGNYHFHTLTAR